MLWEDHDRMYELSPQQTQRDRELLRAAGYPVDELD